MRLPTVSPHSNRRCRLFFSLASFSPPTHPSVSLCTSTGLLTSLWELAQYGAPAMMWAVSEGHDQVVSSLLAVGVSPEATDMVTAAYGSSSSNFINNCFPMLSECTHCALYFHTHAVWSVCDDAGYAQNSSLHFFRQRPPRPPRTPNTQYR